MGILSTIVTVILALIGTPLFVVIAVSGMVFLYFGQIPFSALIIELYKLAHTPMLVALPLFALAGYILAASRAPERLVRFSQAFLGWVPGGLGVVALVFAAVFTALTGAIGLTIVALGGLLYPALLSQGYPEKFSLGLVATSGTLGLLFPPSLPLILYGVLAGTNVDQLFRRDPAGHTDAGAFFPVQRLESLTGRDCPAGFHLERGPGGLAASDLGTAPASGGTGGIYTGFVAISEAAALTVIYVLVVEVLIYRDIRLRELPAVIIKSAVLVGGILIILGVSFGLTNTLINEEIPTKLLEFLQARVESPLVFLLWLNVFLLVTGCLVEVLPAMVVLVPLIVPLAQAYDIHPVHLGIILLTNMQIGASTPPVGINLFVASIRFERPVLDLYRASIPFVLILLVALAIITYWPWLSLALL